MLQIILLFLYIISSLQTISYSSNGNNWADLCSSGQEQSPVDLTVLKGTCQQDMVLDIEWSSFNVQTQLIKTDTIIVANGAWGHLYATTVDGDLYGYDGTSIQFHSPAEHQIEGSTFDLEMQFSYKIKNEFSSYSRDTAIFSVVFKLDDINNVQIFNALNPQTLSTNLIINISNVMSPYLSTPFVYYTYKGSYTVPNCSESVNWYIAANYLGISTIDLKKFTQYWSDNLAFANGTGNNRGIQNLDGRTILQGGIQCQEQFVYFFSFFILYIFINYFIFKLL